MWQRAWVQEGERVNRRGSLTVIQSITLCIMANYIKKGWSRILFITSNKCISFRRRFLCCWHPLCLTVFLCSTYVNLLRARLSKWTFKRAIKKATNPKIASFASQPSRLFYALSCKTEWCTIMIGAFIRRSQLPITLIFFPLLSRNLFCRLFNARLHVIRTHKGYL